MSYYRIGFTLTDLSDGERVIFSDGPVIMAKALGDPLFSLCAEMTESCLSNRTFFTLSRFGEFMNLLIQSMTVSGDSRIRHAVDQISAHYTEETDLAMLAEECHLSKAQFFRKFRQSTGLTPLEYRNRLRIEKAKTLLCEGDCNMSELAGMLGFGSIYYFSRVFKATVGVPPHTYARQSSAPAADQ